MKSTLLILAVLLLWGGALAQTSEQAAEQTGVSNTDNRIDLIRPDAPELAAHGPYDIGVRTLDLVNEDELDVVNAVPGEPVPRYDRPLTVEVWYPAELSGAEPRGEYAATTRDGTPTTLVGRAVRDAEPDTEGAPYPLIILSHGYPGNRFLLSHLGENLASKGYVTVSVDHTDSTYLDQAAFGSTLLNRPLDQQFVLDEMARLSQNSEGFLAGLADTDDTGVVGYSMGAYGAVNLLGGGFTQASVASDYAPPNEILALRQAGNEAFEGSVDPRIKAAVAIAPWGMNTGFWDAEGLAGIDTPVFFMAGSADDVSGYREGTKAIFERAVNAERYLLTFENANHNAAAPIPAPTETWGEESFMHYADAVWDTVRMNNIAQHFATAFFDLELKGDEAKGAYLDLLRNAEDGVYAVDEEGDFTEEHTYWRGFPNRTAVGLSLEHKTPSE